MTESKNDNTNMEFIAVIVVALGIVGYKWYQQTNFYALFQELIPLIIFIIVITLVSGWMLSHIAYSVTQERKYYLASKIFQHTIVILIIASFIYRSIPLANINFDLSYIVHLVLVIIIMLYYNNSYYKNKFERIEKQRIATENFRKEQKPLIEFLNFTPTKSAEIKKLLESVKYKEYTDNTWKTYFTEVTKKKTELKKKYEKLLGEEEVEKLLNEKEKLTEEVQTIKTQKERLKETEDEKDRKIIDDMRTPHNNVFIKSELNNKQIELLAEEGYIQANEYDLLEQRIITVMIDKVMNHSKTHTFLVWSTKRFIEEKFIVQDLDWHDTHDADITFKYKGKHYAIEIETGTLLKKNRHIAEKIKFLNRKYPKRWMFIISNRNLLSKYKQYGLTCQRKTIEKTLTKMLTP